MDAAEYDCQSCGACCVAGSYDSNNGYVGLDDKDTQRLLSLPVVAPHVQKRDDGYGYRLGTKPYENTRACAAFEGTVAGVCQCSIYEDRPKRCRTFDVGNHWCLIYRKKAGLPT